MKILNEDMLKRKRLENIYHCKSPRQLSEEEQNYLAEKLRCIVLEVGRIENEERWDYVLTNKKKFSEEDFRVIEEKGLTLLLNPPQAKKIEQTYDIFQLPAVVAFQRYYQSLAQG